MVSAWVDEPLTVASSIQRFGWRAAYLLPGLVAAGHIAHGGMASHELRADRDGP